LEVDSLTVELSMQALLFLGVIGGGLKYIDEVFDEGVFSRRAAYLLAPLLVGMWVTLSLRDGGSATILLAVLLGVLLSGKVDNGIFRWSAYAILAALFLSGRLEVLWGPLLVLVVAGWVDEKGNDWVDEGDAPRPLEFFFLHRFGMKVACLLLFLHGSFLWYHWAGFLTFDLAYDLVGWLGDRAAASSPALGQASQPEPIL
jgi:hypothetical protein